MTSPDPSNTGRRAYPAPPLVLSGGTTMTATCDYVVPVVGEELERVLRAAVHATPELMITGLYPDEARMVHRAFGQFGYVWIGFDLTPVGADATFIAGRSKSFMDLSGGAGLLTTLMDNIRTELSKTTS